MSGAIGFIGLGAMGAPMAANMAAGGVELVVHDKLGAANAPAGATFVESVADVAAAADTLFLSLPELNKSPKGCGSPLNPCSKNR